MTHTHQISVNDIPLDNAIIKEINRSISTYAAAGIDITFADFTENVLTVIITQSRLVNGYILNNKELYNRAKEVFNGINQIKLKVIPNVFFLNVDNITIQWIKNKMDEFGIKINDLIKQLAIDKSSLSLMLSGERKMNKSVKALFFYYFLTYELNRDFRQNV